jgi:phospholipid/cholesterol/gamma-HCH transport system substrate-binding protein
MLTRFVRIQLIVFTVASVVAVVVLAFTYMQVPTLLGIGRFTVTMELPASGGLYRFSNVTFRGVQIGKVTDVRVTAPTRAVATLSLNTSPKIPADLVAEVRSVSAIGEQYVDLRPRNDSPPYLHDGSVIAAHDTVLPQQVGPMTDQVSNLIESIPKGKLSDLLDETFTALNGAAYDLGSLADSSATLSADLNGAGAQTRSLIDDGGPLLDTQAQTADSIRTWARSLAGVSEQVANDDQQVRTLLQTGPGFAQEVSRLLGQVKPTLPVLLANLSAIEQVLVTYNASLEQLLVLLPPTIASFQTFGRIDNNPIGIPQAEFALNIADPPACTVGFLPPSQWRSPADTTTVDTPDGLYCKLPQDSPIAVRGARNVPCMEHPGKRAPTVEICNSDRPFEPLAMRQHVTGPYPFDPNLVSQGIPLDDRVDFNERIHAPIEGTPMPPEVLPGAVPLPAEPPPVEPPLAEPAPADAPPAAVPSSFGTSGPGPSFAVAKYNPRTGEYLGTDGKWHRQANVATAVPQSWEQLLPVA